MMDIISLVLSVHRHYACTRAGCRTILVDSTSDHKALEQGVPKPNYKAVNMKEAVNIIKRQNQLSKTVDKQDGAASVEESASAVGPVIGEKRAERRETNFSDTKSEQLLIEILKVLKHNQRSEMFNEFSMMKLFAGVAQFIVLASLLLIGKKALSCPSFYE